MTRRRAGSLLAIGMAVLVIPGCGSSVSPAAYVKSVCTALGNWKNTIQGAAVALESSGAATAARSVAKEDYQRFVGSLVLATRHAASALHSAGTPSVAHGQRIAGRLTKAFDRATRGLQKASSDIRGIGTSNSAAFQSGFNTVSVEIKSALEQIALVSPGENEELRSAASKQSSCQVLS